MRLARMLSCFPFTRLLAAALLLAVAGAAQAQLRAVSVLKSGESLKHTDYLSAANKSFSAIMTYSGEFIIYDGNPPNMMGMVWRSPFPNSPGDYVATLKNDGDFVVIAPNGKQFWSAGSGGKPPGNYFAVLENSGSLAIYAGTGPAAQGAKIWSTPAPVAGAPRLGPRVSSGPPTPPGPPGSGPSGYSYPTVPPPNLVRAHISELETLQAGGVLVSAGKTHMATMQRDGNLVVYRGSDINNPKKVPIWDSGSCCRPQGDYRLVLQNDGALYVMGPGSAVPLWSAGSGGRKFGKFYAVIQDDGNFVIYAGDAKVGGPATWSSKTGLIAAGAPPKPPATPVQAVLWDGKAPLMDGQKIAIQTGHRCNDTIYCIGHDGSHRVEAFGPLFVGLKTWRRNTGVPERTYLMPVDKAPTTANVFTVQAYPRLTPNEYVVGQKISLIAPNGRYVRLQDGEVQADSTRPNEANVLILQTTPTGFDPKLTQKGMTGPILLDNGYSVTTYYGNPTRLRHENATAFRFHTDRGLSPTVLLTNIGTLNASNTMRIYLVR